MKRLLGILIATAWLSGSGPAARGDEKDATPILDKAIAALGGEAKLSKALTATWKCSGTTTKDNITASLKSTITIDGIDRHREEVEMGFNGNLDIKGVTILDGRKGWRKFGEYLLPLSDDEVDAARQQAYLDAVVRTVLPLKTKDFKVQAAPDASVGGKQAAVVKATGPDGKAFTLYFEKETGLPVKLDSTIRFFEGEDLEQQAIYTDYKDFGGIKRATKVNCTRKGNAITRMEYTDFKLIDRPEARAFSKPN